jgi:hypothetical protein
MWGQHRTTGSPVEPRNFWRGSIAISSAHLIWSPSTYDVMCFNFHTVVNLFEYIYKALGLMTWALGMAMEIERERWPLGPLGWFNLLPWHGFLAVALAAAMRSFNLGWANHVQKQFEKGHEEARQTSLWHSPIFIQSTAKFHHWIWGMHQEMKWEQYQRQFTLDTDWPLNE